MRSLLFALTLAACGGTTEARGTGGSTWTQLPWPSSSGSGSSSVSSSGSSSSGSSTGWSASGTTTASSSSSGAASSSSSSSSTGSSTGGQGSTTGSAPPPELVTGTDPAGDHWTLGGQSPDGTPTTCVTGYASSPSLTGQWLQPGDTCYPASSSLVETGCCDPNSVCETSPSTGTLTCIPIPLHQQLDGYPCSGGFSGADQCQSTTCCDNVCEKGPACT
jgi:hypothetical protein